MTKDEQKIKKKQFFPIFPKKKKKLDKRAWVTDSILRQIFSQKESLL